LLPIWGLTSQWVASCTNDSATTSKRHVPSQKSDFKPSPLGEALPSLASLRIKLTQAASREFDASPFQRDIPLGGGGRVAHAMRRNAARSDEDPRNNSLKISEESTGTESSLSADNLVKIRGCMEPTVGKVSSSLASSPLHIPVNKGRRSSLDSSLPGLVMRGEHNAYPTSSSNGLSSDPHSPGISSGLGIESPSSCLSALQQYTMEHLPKVEEMADYHSVHFDLTPDPRKAYHSSPLPKLVSRTSGGAIDGISSTSVRASSVVELSKCHQQQLLQMLSPVTTVRGPRKSLDTVLETGSDTMRSLVQQLAVLTRQERRSLVAPLPGPLASKWLASMHRSGSDDD